jgi:hypothetical protein
VRRYGDNAALDDQYEHLGRAPERELLYAFADKQREYARALVELEAPDQIGISSSSRGVAR